MKELQKNRMDINQLVYDLAHEEHSCDCISCPLAEYVDTARGILIDKETIELKQRVVEKLDGHTNRPVIWEGFDIGRMGLSELQLINIIDILTRNKNEKP